MKLKSQIERLEKMLSERDSPDRIFYIAYPENAGLLRAPNGDLVSPDALPEGARVIRVEYVDSLPGEGDSDGL